MVTSVDLSTLVIVLCNIVGFAIVEYRLNRKQAQRESVRNWQLEMMWRTYAREHGIGNGDNHSEV